MDIVSTDGLLPAMTELEVAKVSCLEEALLTVPQVEIKTTHKFHAGVYARTIKIPEGVLLTGALIKIPTVLILSGDATVYIGDQSVRMTGYHVLTGSQGRKQAFATHRDTWLTMIFATEANTIEEAEQQFTDEVEMLGSRREP